MKLAGEVSPDFDEEKIHKIRTTIKKIRAIGVWINMPVKKFFRDNYKLLGKIRDTQLVLSKIKKDEYVVPEPFTNWLGSGLHHLKAKWQKEFDHKKIKDELKSLANTFDDIKYDNRHSLKFENAKNDRLNIFTHERPISDDQIHAGRKTIKQIDYLNKWEKKNSGEQLKMLSDETGNFMDKISAIELLEQYIAQETDELKRNEAESVLEQWKNNKELEKIKLLKNIDLMPV